MINLIIGSISITLSTLITIFTPVFTGTSIQNNKNKNTGLIERLIIIIFYIVDTLRLSFLFTFLYEVLYKIINKAFSHIAIIKNFEEDEEESICTLIFIILVITMITFLYGLIGEELFPDIFKSLSDNIVGGLGEEKISLKLVIDIFLCAIESFPIILKTNLWILKLLLLCLLSIAYIGIIYWGLKRIDQIKKESKLKFNIKSLNIKNFLILSGIMLIFNIVMGVLPAFDKLKLIIDILSIYNIEISVSAAASIAIPVVAEKTVRHIIHNNLKESHAFDKRYK